jgi:3-hydroxy-9,10-secoandrosta-1,3,5(10)-triene-9,17-dione monooxygenase
MLWAAHLWLQCLWPVEAMDEMFADPTSVASSVVTTTGDVTPVDGGFHWTGKGLFSSGVDHCDWLTALVPIKQEGVEVPEFRWLLLPRSDFTIIDDWNTVGLRGTGSKTIVVEDVFIPEYRTLTQQSIDDGEAPGRAVHTHPMYGAVSQVNFTGAMSAPAIGAARGLVEAVLDRHAKRAQAAVNTTNNPYLGDGFSVSLARLSHAAAQVDAAHAMLLVDAQRFGTAPAKTVTEEQRKRLHRNMTFTAQQARRAANTLYEEGGGSGLVENSIQQQLWRDTNGASAHRALTWDWQADAWPKAVLGIEP